MPLHRTVCCYYYYMCTYNWSDYLRGCAWRRTQVGVKLKFSACTLRIKLSAWDCKTHNIDKPTVCLWKKWRVGCFTLFQIWRLGILFSIIFQINEICARLTGTSHCDKNCTQKKAARQGKVDTGHATVDTRLDTCCRVKAVNFKPVTQLI